MEIGPRMTLSLMKIQDGFCDGSYIHQRDTRTSSVHVDARTDDDEDGMHVEDSGISGDDHDDDGEKNENDLDGSAAY